MGFFSSFYALGNTLPVQEQAEQEVEYDAEHNEPPLDAARSLGKERSQEDEAGEPQKGDQSVPIARGIHRQETQGGEKQQQGDHPGQVTGTYI